MSTSIRQRYFGGLSRNTFLLAFASLFADISTEMLYPVLPVFLTQQFPKAYWKYLLVTAVFGIGNSSNAFLILQTNDMGASLTTTILIYSAFNLVAALVSYPAGLLSDRWGRRNILLVSFILFLAVYLGFALTQNIALIAGLFALYGAYQGIFRSVGKALATDLVPEHLRASGIGWYSTTIGLLGLVASVIAGLLWDDVGHAAMFVYGAVFAASGSLALVMLIPTATGAAQARH
jgi:MFS family permease